MYLWHFYHANICSHIWARITQVTVSGPCWSSRPTFARLVPAGQVSRSCWWTWSDQLLCQISAGDATELSLALIFKKSLCWGEEINIFPETETCKAGKPSALVRVKDAAERLCVSFVPRRGSCMLGEDWVWDGVWDVSALPPDKDTHSHTQTLPLIHFPSSDLSCFPPSCLLMPR